MARCEVCGKKAEIHHIVNRCQGGIDFDLNYKYLCSEHHRGENGPHKNWKIDLQYKLEMQENLCEILLKDFYNLEEISYILHINKNKTKKIMKHSKVYKEGYKKEDIIFKLMGNELYELNMLADYNDEFIPLFVG
ncbi:HNH endonuclease signature motif containing protein [Clostridium malenominatum]|uniref:HNH endonuclease signature motif containing protein n=1 Tax=Clostridium malenominatum TaxID=1539 RepID=A0ABP3TUE0_9CLOT